LACFEALDKAEMACSGNNTGVFLFWASETKTKSCKTLDSKVDKVDEVDPVDEDATIGSLDSFSPGDYFALPATTAAHCNKVCFTLMILPLLLAGAI
jgi:hypothetical protein